MTQSSGSEKEKKKRIEKLLSSCLGRVVCNPPNGIRVLTEAAGSAVVGYVVVGSVVVGSAMVGSAMLGSVVMGSVAGGLQL